MVFKITPLNTRKNNAHNNETNEIMLNVKIIIFKSLVDALLFMILFQIFYCLICKLQVKRSVTWISR